MQASELFAVAFGRITDLAHRCVVDASAEVLQYRPDPGSNSIAWLVWHLSRVQDNHVSEIVGVDQAWVAQDWARRFGKEPDPADDGRGYGPEDVARIAPDAVLLAGYHDAVAEQTQAYLASAGAAEFDRIIDRSYDPPVSVGVRLVSVINDNIQHLGQARYLRGLTERLCIDSPPAPN